MSACTWVLSCEEQGNHPVWRQTRPGLILHEEVCDQHLPQARRRGYREGPSPISRPGSGSTGDR
jgi:hypothetical protein